MSSTENATRCMPISLGMVGCVSIASGWMYSKSSSWPCPSGVPSMAIFTWFPSRPTAVSAHSPRTVSRPTTLSPRSVKNATAASMSRTAMPTFSSLMAMVRRYRLRARDRRLTSRGTPSAREVRGHDDGTGLAGCHPGAGVRLRCGCATDQSRGLAAGLLVVVVVRTVVRVVGSVLGGARCRGLGEDQVDLAPSTLERGEGRRDLRVGAHAGHLACGVGECFDPAAQLVAAVRAVALGGLPGGAELGGVGLDVGATFVGQRGEVAPAVRRRRHEAFVGEESDRRVHGAGARPPRATQALGDLLDDLVAMHGLLGEQEQDRGAHVAASGSATTAAASTATAATGAEGAAGSEAARAVRAERAAGAARAEAARSEAGAAGAEAAGSATSATTATARGLVVVELAVVAPTARSWSGREVHRELCLGTGAEGCRTLLAGLVEGCVSHGGSPE